MTTRRCLLLCTLLVVFSRHAQAHPDLQDSISVRIEQKSVRISVNVSLNEICISQGISPRLGSRSTGPDRFKPSESLNRAAETHGQYWLKHFTISAEKPLEGRLVRVTPPKSLSEPVFYEYDFEYKLAGSVPKNLVLFQDMLKDCPFPAGLAPEVSYLVRLPQIDSDKAPSCRLFSSGESLNVPTGLNTAPEAQPIGAQPPKATQAAGPPPAPSRPMAERGQLFSEFLRHGIKHILTGYDHLLFVSVLVLATISLGEMVQVIAAFTLAHTLTLTLCVFGIFRLPAWVVEPVIALSIVFVAVENVLWQHRAHSRLRLLVAFGFGLIHGLGFAGGLLDSMAGLPSAGIWIALASFSLGVEIGHQLVVLPLFGVLNLSRRLTPPDWHFAALRYASIGISLCGAYFLAVALHEQGLLWR